MKKKLTAFLLILALLCALLPQTLLLVSAENPISGTCGENLTWSYDESTGRLTIEGSGDMTDYEWESDVPWFTFRESISGVTFPDGLTSIGDNAFCYCTKLFSAVIPNSVSKFGSSAFWGCKSLAYITFPEVITEIGSAAFELTAFYNNSSNWDGSALYVNDWLVALKTNYSGSFEVRAGTRNIAPNAFNQCSGVTEIILPQGLAYIGAYAFYACKALTKIELPEGITTIEIGTFSNCESLKRIEIPSGVFSIEEDAFYSCSELSEVVLHEGVVSIGKSAFEGCFSLKTIILPKSLETIGDRAFRSSSIETIAIPENVKSIGNGTFNYCTGLTSITIPDGVTRIGNDTFQNCTSMKSITIPSSVTSIGKNAFDFCEELEEVHIFDIAAWCEISFESNPLAFAERLYLNEKLVTELVIPYGVTRIGDYTFDSLATLTSVSIPNSVTSIGIRAFSGCEGLTSVILPDSVTCIEDETFNGCSGLTSVTIPNSVITIGEYAFGWCDNLSDVYFGGTEEEWNEITIGEYNVWLMDATFHFGALSVDPCEGYTDVKANSWYYSATQFVIDRGIMGSTSTSELTFEPSTKCSRSMIMSMLYRLAGAEKPAYETKFSDVPEGKWFTDAIIWAANAGIVNGYTDGRFGPNDMVSREQLAVILKAYTEKIASKATSQTANLSTFPDNAKVTWSKASVSWAVAVGLISGKSNNGQTLLDPQGQATRAEVASILMRFIENIIEA